MRAARLVFSTLVVVFAARGAAAQTVVGGTVGISNQSAGASDLPYLGRGFGGTVLAVVGTFDHAFKRHLMLGAEVSTAAAITGDQSQRTSGATNAFESRHRDTVFSATAKFFVPEQGRVRIAGVAGAGTAWRRTSREGTTSSLFPPASRTPFSETLSNFVFAYTFGADVTVQLTGRLSILVLGRVHKLRDDDLQDDGVVRRGVSSTVYRAAAGAQWHF